MKHKMRFTTLAKRIVDKFPHVWIKDARDFNGSDGLWTGEGSEIDGISAFDHYADNSLYIMGVHKKLSDFLHKLGFYAEWYDAGTIIIYRL